uniref:DUF5641 domain-containing protein n=1 Tax=Caenorhabditis tropicalis TaxID=1561998 RepID=A0A1I7T7H8_9PELO
MAERKIEKTYFHNIEQAERKLKKLTLLKSKWAEPWQEGEEILAEEWLKPRSHENPWKDGKIQGRGTIEIEKNNKHRGSCVIS